MKTKKWSAQWIEYNPEPLKTNPVFKNNSQLFYNDFFIKELPETAFIDICGLGFYYLKINGKLVSDDLLNPAFSAYDKTIYYNTYNITSFLKKGINTIEVSIGNGWFFEVKKTPWEFEHATWHTRPQLICELFADNNIILKSDSSWKCGRSKTIYNSLRYGETYDSTVEFNDHINASIAHGPGGILKAQKCPPIKLINTFEPIKIINNNIYDFGINLVGNVEITVKGQRGDQVDIQYFERLDSNYNPDYKYLLPDMNLDRFQHDTFILAGEGTEKWHSQFGYNGFRYVQITGNAEIIAVKARHFHTALKSIGSFECDNKFFNELQQAIIHSTLCNYHHMPTDCPHREKNGWTGDAHLSCEQAMFNLDMKESYLKWLDDIVDSQRLNGAIPCIAPTSIWGYNWGSGNAWDVALFEIPWHMYLFYGEKSILDRYLPAMKKYITFLENMCDNGIWHNGLGDWCAPKNVKTASIESILTGYAFRIFDLYSKITGIMNDSDHEQSIIKANNVRNTFISVFEDNEPDSQALLSMQLNFNLTNKPNEIFERLLKQIENSNYHINCGIFGVKWMFNILSKYGRHDIACKILEQESYPSYKNMLSNSNGTLCEDWECEGSLNHHMYSSIGDWFYKSVAGINIDENHPGFKNIILTPHICEGYKEFKASHMTPYGLLSIEFKNSKFYVTLPKECTADFTFKNINKHLTSSEVINID